MIANIKFRFECSKCLISREVDFLVTESTSLEVFKAMALNKAEELGWTNVEEATVQCIRCSSLEKLQNERK